jgi:hypothetical protein
VIYFYRNLCGPEFPQTSRHILGAPLKTWRKVLIPTAILLAIDAIYL